MLPPSGWTRHSWALLEKKDLAYITVKEICEAAGINRSTFYLHYETIGDLLAESVEHMNRHFQDYMAHDSEIFVTKLHTCPLEELYLVTPEYLVPYLRYIRGAPGGFSARRRKTPLCSGWTVPMTGCPAMYSRRSLSASACRSQDRPYMMTFYIRGLMAIIAEWLKGDCSDPEEHIIAVIHRCVMPHQEEA